MLAAASAAEVSPCLSPLPLNRAAGRRFWEVDALLHERVLESLIWSQALLRIQYEAFFKQIAKLLHLPMQEIHLWTCTCMYTADTYVATLPPASAQSHGRTSERNRLN